MDIRDLADRIKPLISSYSNYRTLIAVYRVLTVEERAVSVVCYRCYISTSGSIWVSVDY